MSKRQPMRPGRIVAETNAELYRRLAEHEAEERNGDE